jgi:hypothetical protein
MPMQRARAIIGNLAAKKSQATLDFGELSTIGLLFAVNTRARLMPL